MKFALKKAVEGFLKSNRVSTCTSDSTPTELALFKEWVDCVGHFLLLSRPPNYL